MMSSPVIIELAQQALLLVLLLSLPAACTAMIVGIGIGILQSVTQVQDQSISYAAKLIAVSVVLIVTANWLGSHMYRFSEALFHAMAEVGRH